MIDGEVTSYFEWAGAGRFQPDNRSGSMHSGEPKIRDVYYGADDDNLYLRLDFDDGFAVQRCWNCAPGRRQCPLLDDPAVQFAKKRILEIGVPFSALGMRERNPDLLSACHRNRDIPSEGWIDIASPS